MKARAAKARRLSVGCHNVDFALTCALDWYRPSRPDGEDFARGMLHAFALIVPPETYGLATWAEVDMATALAVCSLMRTFSAMVLFNVLTSRAS